MHEVQLGPEETAVKKSKRCEGDGIPFATNTRPASSSAPKLPLTYDAPATLSTDTPSPSSINTLAVSTAANPPAVTTGIVVWAAELVAGLAGQVSDGEVAILQSQMDELSRAPTKVSITPDPTVPVIVRDQSTLKQLATAVAEATELVVDIETSDLNHHTGEIVGIGLATGNTTYYIPTAHRFEHGGALRPDQLPLINVLIALQLQGKHLIGHNAKFETKWLGHHGKIRCRFIWDTMIAARLLRSDLPAKLKTVAQRELDVPDWGLTDAEIKRVQVLPIEMIASYCAKDCWHTLLLYRSQKTCLV